MSLEVQLFSQLPYLWPCSPAEETTDLKSVQRGFESHYGYQIFNMENCYKNEIEVLKQAPSVEKLQSDKMHELDFKAVNRDGSWVLWELMGWPEVSVWLQGFQVDLNIRYILMQVYKSGKDSGREFQVNEFRLNLGMPVLTREDAKRLSAFESPWLACEMNPRHGRHES
jgi:hypothetical protein